MAAIVAYALPCATVKSDSDELMGVVNKTSSGMVPVDQLAFDHISW